jgi:hypothetical protein
MVPYTGNSSNSWPANRDSLGRSDLQADDGLADLALQKHTGQRHVRAAEEEREFGEDGGQSGPLTMPRTEESKLTSQRRRSSPALRMTGRDPERPRRAAIADMSMAAGASEGSGSVLGVETGSGRQIWAFWRGEIVAIWAVSGSFWRAREMAGEGNRSLSRLACLERVFPFGMGGGRWGWRDVMGWTEPLGHLSICCVLVRALYSSY